MSSPVRNQFDGISPTFLLSTSRLSWECSWAFDIKSTWRLNSGYCLYTDNIKPCPNYIDHLYFAYAMMKPVPVMISGQNISFDVLCHTHKTHQTNLINGTQSHFEVGWSKANEDYWMYQIWYIYQHLEYHRIRKTWHLSARLKFKISLNQLIWFLQRVLLHSPSYSLSPSLYSSWQILIRSFKSK